MDQFERNRTVDVALRLAGDGSDRQAAAQIGVSATTFQRWRALRLKGEDIPEPRGAGKATLMWISQLIRDGERGGKGGIAARVTERPVGTATLQAANESLASAIRIAEAALHEIRIAKAAIEGMLPKQGVSAADLERALQATADAESVAGQVARPRKASRRRAG